MRRDGVVNMSMKDKNLPHVVEHERRLIMMDCFLKECNETTKLFSLLIE